MKKSKKQKKQMLTHKLFETITMNQDKTSCNVRYTIISGDKEVSKFTSFCPENPYDMESHAPKGTCCWDWTENHRNTIEGRLEAREEVFRNHEKRAAMGRPYQITFIGEWEEPEAEDGRTFT